MYMYLKTFGVVASTSVFHILLTDWSITEPIEQYVYHIFICVYVTGYWKTRNLTLGLFHFIAAANSHTHKYIC